MTSDLDHVKCADEPYCADINQTVKSDEAENGPVIVSRYTVVDANGKSRQMIRTRSGREIPVLADDEADEFFAKYTYDDEVS